MNFNFFLLTSKMSYHKLVSRLFSLRSFVYSAGYWLEIKIRLDKNARFRACTSVIKL